MDLGKQVPIIIDASILLKDVRFQVSEGVRTVLHEAIHAGAVRPISPAYAFDEMEEKIIQIAEREQRDVDELFSVWDKIHPKIDVRNVEEDVEKRNQEEVPDPDDLPYLVLQEQTGYPILTKDPHFEQMDAETIPITIREPLREYA